MFISIIRNFCRARCVEYDTYMSIILSLLNDEIILCGSAEKDVIEVLLKEIIRKYFRKRFTIKNEDFKKIINE